ncbi:DUF4282 domain-containing protein [Actinocorallia sp. API 0066]|uniref:DUF4282 domain-containing protein n=1 Tax=Actinocorallia sp. API 0066 TaxID=2896846 RepID=UPI001E506269|nr:DUF4282 domain-containing protein [Actinocorallia sp. API 0066]MCD0447932.1 DUF4282 domain-containing protein [Actinocorallia sp. API 0066]
MTTPPEQPRFNPHQYGVRPDTPPQQTPPPQAPPGPTPPGPTPPGPQRPPGPPPQWQQGGPQHTGPQPVLPPQGDPRPPAGPPPVRRRGFFGSLLDTRFDAMVTPMLIRGFYILSLVIITLFSIGLFLFIWGLGGNNPYEDASAWPLVIACVVAPLTWIFQVVMVRLALEFVINQFKITEELQKIRRSTGQR